MCFRGNGTRLLSFHSFLLEDELTHLAVIFCSSFSGSVGSDPEPEPGPEPPETETVKLRTGVPDSSWSVRVRVSGLGQAGTGSLPFTTNHRRADAVRPGPTDGRTDRHRTHLPTKFSSTELFPALWPPTTAICGRSRLLITPMEANASWSRFTSGIRSSMPRFPMTAREEEERTEEERTERQTDREKERQSGGADRHVITDQLIDPLSACSIRRSNDQRGAAPAAPADAAAPPVVTFSSSSLQPPSAPHTSGAACHNKAPV